MTAGDSKSQKKKPAEKVKEQPSEGQSRASVLLLLGSWFLPGLGHWRLGKKRRAVVFAAVVFCAFITGVLLDGEIGTPKPESPFSWLAAFACLGNGVLAIGRLVWLNGLGGLLGNGLVREDPDPDLPTPFDVPGHGHTGRFDLAVGDPRRFLGLEAVFPEGNFVSTGGLATHLALVRLPVFDPLGR